MSLLSACPPTLAARWDAEGGLSPDLTRAFLQAQVREGLVHGARPLCSVLSPLVLSRRLYQRVQEAAGEVLAALERVVTEALADPTLGCALGLGPRERALCAREAEVATRDGRRPQAAVAIGRLDMVFTEGAGESAKGRGAGRAEAGDAGDDADHFAFLELNAESPAGIVDQSAIEATLFRLPVVQSWLGGTRSVPTDPPRALLRGLCESHGRWGGVGLPGVAIVDWQGGETAAEQQWLCTFFNEHGLATRLADPSQLEYRAGRLLAQGAPVSLVYRRVIGRELLERVGDDHPLLRALVEGSACIVNPLRSGIANRKAAFAVLSDPAWDHLFTPAQRAAIARHVPWSRVLGPEAQGETGDAALLARQDELVIKPNDDYGGKGVVLGWAVSPETWRRAIAEGRASRAVVQERLYCRRLSFPAFAGPACSDPEKRATAAEPALGGLYWRELSFDCDPFLFNGQVEGAMVRVSESALSNVSAGGGVTGMLVVDDQPPLAPVEVSAGV